MYLYNSTTSLLTMYTKVLFIITYNNKRRQYPHMCMLHVHYLQLFILLYVNTHGPY